MKMRLVLVIVLPVAALSGCGGGGGSKRVVVAAFYPLAFAAERIAGPADRVVNLTPAGAEPHDLELSPRDVETVRSAAVVLYLGGGFQPALEHALDGAKGTTLDLLIGEGIAAGDPHVWLDPLLFAGMVERIGEALGRRPAAQALAARLRELHREYLRGLAACDRRVLVTSHASFGYLARRYDLEQIAIAGVSPEAEPTPRQLERVVERVRRAGVTTLFFETLASPRVAEAVAREVGAKTAVLDPLEGLTEREIDAGEDYLSVMRTNLATLRAGLGCR